MAGLPVGPLLADDLILLAATDTWERMHAEGSIHPAQSYLAEGGGFERYNRLPVPDEPAEEEPPEPYERLVALGPLKVQSVLLPKTEFDKHAAKEWVRKYKFPRTAVDGRGNFWRFRQLDPDDVDPESYVTKPVGEHGALLVLARVK